MWTDRTNHIGLIESPLMAPLSEGLSFDASRASKFHWDFKVDAKTVMEYITQVLCWQRLCMLEATDDDTFSGVQYWTDHILIWDVLEENWGGEVVLGFPGFGQKALDLLSVRLDGERNSPEYKEAYKLTWHLLSQCSMQKVCFTMREGCIHSA
jgi:hypothetical protein